MSAAVNPDPDFEALLVHLRNERGFDFTGYKRPSLRRLVDKRLNAIDAGTYADYVDLLQADPGEFDRLFDMLLINVTSFYRDTEAWEVLQAAVVPALLTALPPDEPVRVWSAGCSSGQEAYALAMVLAETMGEQEFLRRVKIFGTDLDENALAQARTASYPLQAFAALNEDLVGRYFESQRSELTFRKDLRPAFVFGQHDLTQDAPISRVGLLACRNTLVYFNQETQARILARLHFSLHDAGFLFLGRAETLLTHRELFTPYALTARIFAKARLDETPVQELPPRRGRPKELEAAVPLSSRIFQSAFATGTDPQFLVDPGHRVLLVNDLAERELGVHRGDVGRTFRDLELLFQLVELRSAIEQVLLHRTAVEHKDVAWSRVGLERWYDVAVVPLVDGDGRVLAARVTFSDVTRYHRMSQELAAAHRDVEAAYEELQSSSEEMQTLNDELRDRVGETSEVNAFMESVLTGLRGAMVVLDADLRVRLWDDRVVEMWGLRAHEAQGQHFLDLAIGLPVATLGQLLTEVVGGDRPRAESLVPATNRLGHPVQISLTITPMHTPVRAISGVVLLMEQVES